MIALCAPLASVLLTTALVKGAWSASEFEKFLRFALACPICWLLLRAPVRWLQQVQWSLLFSALAGSAMLIVIMHDAGMDVAQSAISAADTTPSRSPI